MQNHDDKGKAWSFTALERHVFFDKTGKTAGLMNWIA
jgi:hypothetical protein